MGGKLPAPTGWVLRPPTAAGGSLLKGDMLLSCLAPGWGSTPSLPQPGQGGFEDGMHGVSPRALRQIDPQVQFSSELVL